MDQIYDAGKSQSRSRWAFWDARNSLGTARQSKPSPPLLRCAGDLDGSSDALAACACRPRRGLDDRRRHLRRAGGLRTHHRRPWAMTLIPYLLVAAYGLKLAWTGETYAAASRSRTVDWLRGAIATVYAASMLFAGGPKFVMLSALLYAPGTLLFVIARREQGKPLFTRVEWLLFGVVVAVAIGAVYALASGDISI